MRRGFPSTRVEVVAVCPWNIVTRALLEFYQRFLQVFSDVGSCPPPTARRSNLAQAQRLIQVFSDAGSSPPPIARRSNLAQASDDDLVHARHDETAVAGRTAWLPLRQRASEDLGFARMLD